MILFFLVITHRFPQTFRVIHLTIPLVLATGLLATVKQRVDPLHYTFASIVDSLSTRTCLLNGSWTGSIPQCNCNCSHDIVTQNVTDNDDTCIPNVTSTIVSTNFSDRNPGNVEIVKSPWFFEVAITFGVLLMGFIIGATVVIGLLVATCISKRQLQLELQQLKETIGPILYEDIDPNTDTNVAYSMTGIHLAPTT